MALIKCNECGKEISDKAVACMNCGCPIDIQVGNDKEIKKEHKKENDKVIVVSKRDNALKVFKKFYPKILGIIVAIAIVIIFLMEQSLPMYSASRGNAMIFGFILVILPCIIIYIICNIMYNNAIKTNITLTNKELYGIVYKVGKTYSISFPLDKIASINTIKLLGIIDGIMIIPVNGIPQKIFFIDNGEDFKKAILNEITK